MKHEKMCQVVDSNAGKSKTYANRATEHHCNNYKTFKQFVLFAYEGAQS